jgi:hypothetical protein
MEARERVEGNPLFLSFFFPPEAGKAGNIQKNPAEILYLSISIHIYTIGNRSSRAFYDGLTNSDLTGEDI